MTTIKLADSTIINASEVEQVGELLKITTAEHTVEELAALFSDKTKTAVITLLTESGAESGYVEHYTGFSGITYNADGVKTVTLVYEAVNASEDKIAEMTQKVTDLEATINTMLGTEVE